MLLGIRSPLSRKHTNACYCTETDQCGYCRSVVHPYDGAVQKIPETFHQYCLRKNSEASGIVVWKGFTFRKA